MKINFLVKGLVVSALISGSAFAQTITDQTLLSASSGRDRISICKVENAEIAFLTEALLQCEADKAELAAELMAEKNAHDVTLTELETCQDNLATTGLSANELGIQIQLLQAQNAQLSQAITTLKLDFSKVLQSSKQAKQIAFGGNAKTFIATKKNNKRAKKFNKLLKKLFEDME